MANPKGLQQSKNKISQKFNLKEIFKRDISDREDLKLRFGQLLIDRIRERTQSGQDRTGKQFSKNSYSTEYSKSLPFRARGKSKNNVNMTLRGDMLRSLDIIDISADTITIGFDDDTEEAKAANHNQGITVPKRPFFGITKSEATEIAEENFDIEEETESSVLNALELASAARDTRLVLGSAALFRDRLDLGDI